jgi:hypothetical protein
MGVNEAKAKYETVKKAVSDCQRLISGLTKKQDELLEEMLVLKNSVERSETDETTAFDKFVLGKITQKELDLEKIECRKAKTRYEDSSKMLESLGRGIKKTENDLQRLNAEAELSKRQCWQAVGDEIKSAIPSEVFESIKKLQVIGSQCGQTRSWLLDSLFPNIPSGEFQTIRNELAKKYGIGE